ncbi:MAG: putative Adenylyl cyclase CyaB [Candidatus Saccharibacteria bacterium]|jgi:adenylate cyclase class 2|nr:putative Adenylyl cyclase CyaB [Candidatus Saccharibacteria bacterium]
MREIEIKASISSVESIIAIFTSQGVAVSDPVTQRDRVYGQIGIDGAGENTAPWLRIRSETKQGSTKHIFTLKRSITNQMDSIEHETEVADEIGIEHIIEQLGFEIYSDLTKTRQKANVGEIEICIDAVNELGAFIEAEKLTADEVDYDAVIRELWRVFESLGVNHENEVVDGYDVLMNKKLATVIDK